MITGVPGACCRATCSASLALKCGKEWSVRMTSWSQQRTAATIHSCVSIRPYVQKMSALRTSRSASAASCGLSSTMRIRTVAGTELWPHPVCRPLRGTVRADAVAELDAAVTAHVRLELLPPAVVGGDALTVGADPHESA